MKEISARVWVVAGVALALAACNSGGGSSSTVGVGFDMPNEISAVPPAASSSLKTKLLALAAAADAGTDYSNAVTTKYVDEQTLKQFDIIEQILEALAQTHFADADNVNQGPYKAMVAFQDQQNGIETKSLEPWTVDSSLVTENGATINRVRFWVEEGMQVIKAELKIYEPATRNSDGSWADYGVWTLNAKFDELGTNYFAANASVGANGETILKIHELMAEGGGFTHESKAILNKGATSGYGKVEFPDWEACTSWPCAPTGTTASYAYDATNLAVKKGSGTPLYKDRTTITEMTHRYGLYDSVTGANVLKTKSFGFPVQYTVSGLPMFAYYGAWQGRHQLWANGGSLDEGTVVTRQDRGANQTAETYTVSPPFVGTLTKRTLVTADIADLLNIPVETWVNENFNLKWDAGNSQWLDCTDPTCDPTTPAFTDFASLVANPNDRRKFIGINGWNGVSNITYVYDSVGNGVDGPGFYEAAPDPSTGNMVSNGTILVPNDGDQLLVNIGGSIYIEYTGTGATGWVAKTLLGFDERTWTPSFDPAGDTGYTLPVDREYYINNQGANYVIQKLSDGTYYVKIELQTVANPSNAASFLTPVVTTTFKPQWDQNGGGSIFRLVTSSADANFLKLVYDTVGSNDTTLTNELGNPVQAGDVVTQGVWGLVAYENGVATTQQYNWEYPRPGETWGTLTYLMDSNGAYKLLDDPIALAPVTLTNGAGVSKTLSLRYDGWMHGLPDFFEELRKNGFVVTADIADKIISIPAATSVTDAVDSSKTYLIKPLEVSQFLDVVADPGTLDLTAALAVDLNTVPVFVEHGMGVKPEAGAPKYSEGVLLE
ncbi:MAG: hypothetical protein ABIO65_12585 [Nitrospiria bacterium]